MLKLPFLLIKDSAGEVSVREPNLVYRNYAEFRLVVANAPDFPHFLTDEQAKDLEAEVAKEVRKFREEEN